MKRVIGDRFWRNFSGYFVDGLNSIEPKFWMHTALFKRNGQDPSPY